MHLAVSPQPGSRGVLAAGRHRFQVGLAAAQARQTTGAFAFDQGAQGLTNQGRLFLQTGELLGFGDQFIVQGDGSAHGSHPLAAYGRGEYGIK